MCFESRIEVGRAIGLGVTSIMKGRILKPEEAWHRVKRGNEELDERNEGGWSVEQTDVSPRLKVVWMNCDW
jgi:hypothetical protein